MNLIEALKAGKYVRRPIPKHLGSGRTGWLCREFVIGLLVDAKSVGSFGFEYPFWNLISEVDLLADDWQHCNDGKARKP